jgi:hypothetical protein
MLPAVGLGGEAEVNGQPARRGRRLIGALACFAALIGVAEAAPDDNLTPRVALVGAPEVMFTAERDGCDGSDVPDIPARAFRRADGSIVLFGLHYTNHPLVGRSIGALRIVCRPALLGHENGDPAAYDDRSWIAATWTTDGVKVAALVHHEFQANAHPGRCRFPDYMQCWFNTILAVRSGDGGASFNRAEPPVVASAPFRQDVDQGRHRGFFNPSNIVSDGRWFYMFASTTGWAGQDGGACLFRTVDPGRADGWYAYDGVGFRARFPDPYRTAPGSPHCAPIAPFPAPVGGLVRQRGTGVWFAVFQAKADAGIFPVSGFYVAASRDLLRWSSPRLLLPGPTNYDDPCRNTGSLIAYPSLLDPEASDRNFDNVGPTAALVYARLDHQGCTIGGDRTLLRQSVTLATAP